MGTEIQKYNPKPEDFPNNQDGLQHSFEHILTNGHSGLTSNPERAMSVIDSYDYLIKLNLKTLLSQRGFPIFPCSLSLNESWTILGVTKN